MIGDNLVALDLRVDAGDFLQRVHDGFGEERHEAEFEAVLFDEAVLIFFTQIHHRRHVDFVKSREHGSLVLRGDEALGDLGAKRAHFLARLFCGRSGSGGFSSSRGRRGC